jgi:predicted DNA-binding transcriptional regulator AlpA
MLLTVKQVCEKLGVSRSTLFLMRKNEGFPTPYCLSESAQRWSEQEVDEWVKSRKVERQK